MKHRAAFSRLFLARPDRAMNFSPVLGFRKALICVLGISTERANFSASAIRAASPASNCQNGLGSLDFTYSSLTTMSSPRPSLQSIDVGRMPALSIRLASRTASATLCHLSPDLACAVVVPSDGSANEQAAANTKDLVPIILARQAFIPHPSPMELQSLH